LNAVSKGVVLGFEENFVKSNSSHESSGNYVCFVLVKYPDKHIERMRRLWKSARVLASVVSRDGAGVAFNVSELKGVSIVL
jgi:hypothetical protein